MRKRYYEIDLVRTITLLTLPLIHIYEYIGYQSQMSDLLSDSAVNLLKGPYMFFTLIACPIFVICMGMNLVFSSKNTPDKLIKRGILLLIIELIFNLVRYVIPGLIGIGFGGAENADAFMICFWMVYGMINGDVLALAGYSFILFGLFKKLNLKPLHIFIISIIMFVLDLGIYKYIGINLANTLSTFPNEIYGHFIYVNEDSIFPLLRWFIFPASGYLFGSHINDKDIFKKVGIISLIIVAIGTTGIIITGQNPLLAFNVVENSNELTPIILIGEISLAYFFICLIYQIYHLFKLELKDKFNSFISKFSGLITYYYMIQWTIVGWIMFITGGIHVWGTKALGVIPTIILVLFITIISYPLGIVLRNIIKKHIV